MNDLETTTPINAQTTSAAGDPKTPSDIAEYSFDWTYLIFMLALHGALFLIPWSFKWSYLFAALTLQAVLGGLGICVGYHRLLTHRSFEVPRFVEYVLATLGALSLQGGPIRWVAYHRRHHHYSDNHGDPHTPNQGFWWSHVFWIFLSPDKESLVKLKQRYARDLLKHGYHRFLDRYHVLLQVAFGTACFLIAGWKLLIWAVCVRLVITYHATWFVNSASHTFGYRNFNVTDRSTNCWWVALLTYGEGWHNNHHALPNSARHGLKFYEIDMSYWSIWLMRIVGLAKNVRVPSRESLQKLKRAAREKTQLLDPSEILMIAKRRSG